MAEDVMTGNVFHEQKFLQDDLARCNMTQKESNIPLGD